LSGATSIGGGDFALLADPNWNVGRQAKVDRPVDFNGDGYGDLLWHNTADGTGAIWYMRGAAQIGTAAVPTQADLNWHLIDTADFNGDGCLDLLWHNVATGAAQVWYGPAFTATAALPGDADTTWRIVAAGDFNGDGLPELVWRNTASGANRVWFLNGTALDRSVALPGVADTSWALVAVGDIDGDNQADLVWHKTSGPNAGANSVWFMAGTTLTSAVALDATGTSWQLVGAVDVNGDGYADLVFQNTGSGVIAFWYMNGATVQGYDSAPGSALTQWQLVR
jgi:hypothetical protein